MSVAHALLFALTACGTQEPVPARPSGRAMPPSPSAAPSVRTLGPSAPAPAPSPSAAADPPPPPDPGSANLDPSDDQEVGPPPPIADCEARLTAAGVKHRPGKIPVRAQSNGQSCGAEQVVIYEKGPSGAKWNAPPSVTCAMALGLARFEVVLADEAGRTLGSKPKRIIQGGTYSCRKMARFKLASEHSFANAIDIQGFELEDGRTISVKRHFGKLDAEPSAPEGRFLRATARRTFDQGLFSVVLTPYWDALHADHFHLDQARYRVDGTRPN